MAWGAVIAAGVSAYQGRRAQRRGRQAEGDAFDELDQMRPLIELQAQAGRQMLQRYGEVFQPIEDEFLEAVQETPRPGEAAETARADIETGFAQQRDQMERRARAAGVDTTDESFQRTLRRLDADQAAASAAAQTGARRFARQERTQALGQAAGMGRGQQVQGVQALAQPQAGLRALSQAHLQRAQRQQQLAAGYGEAFGMGLAELTNWSGQQGQQQHDPGRAWRAHSMARGALAQ